MEGCYQSAHPMPEQSFYVYVYIDPRNFEEFYYGKGKGSRKEAHPKDKADTDKTRRLREIEEEGLEAIIRVIAAGLTEQEAFLIEKTLIWKAHAEGRKIDNVATGNFSDKFRPLRTLHRQLPSFDFQNEVHYVNVGVGEHRSWKDCKDYGFVAAGHGRRFSDQLRLLKIGDLVAAYVSKHGYVGIGRVMSSAVPVAKFLVNNRPLNPDKLASPSIYDNCEDPALSEYLVGVTWIKTVPVEEAKFKRKAGLYAKQQVRANLSNQEPTLRFLEEAFDVNFEQEMK